MSERDILIMGEPSLILRSSEVDEFNTVFLSELISEMKFAMFKRDAIGIAAPQIGCNYRVVVFSMNNHPRYPGHNNIPLTVLVNPTVEVLDNSLEWSWEGCLSVPKLRANIARYKKIKYTAFDLYGKKIERIASGFEARIVQHEIDHLDGILFPARVKNLAHIGYEEVLWPKIFGSDYPMEKQFS